MTWCLSEPPNEKRYISGREKGGRREMEGEMEGMNQNKMW
jgi:hypothetical protein